VQCGLVRHRRIWDAVVEEESFWAALWVKNRQREKSSVVVAAPSAWRWKRRWVDKPVYTGTPQRRRCMRKQQTRRERERERENTAACSIRQMVVDREKFLPYAKVPTVVTHGIGVAPIQRVCGDSHRIPRVTLWITAIQADVGGGGVHHGVDGACCMFLRA
jgi:hypothetical protein